MGTYFASKLDGLLITASWSQYLRNQLGLIGASQVWGERPAWYVWLADSPGAYQLELAGASQLDDESEVGLRRAVLAIRHYPNPESEVFPLLSARERALVTGPSFDSTGTPTFESRAAIPLELFMTGALEIWTQAQTDWMLFCLSALTECRESLKAGPERRVPGWDISQRLFWTLLSLWAFQARQTVQRAQLISEGGFEQSPGEVAAATSDIRLLSLAALFCSDPGRPPSWAQAHLDTQAQDPGRLLVEDATYQCRHFHPPSHPSVVGAIHAQCWRFAMAEYQSELSSTCGCQH